MKLGTKIKEFLAPFVKGTKYENCKSCEAREEKINQFSSKAGQWISKIACPCWWKGLLNK